MSSPLQRCVETASVLADALGALTVDTVEDLGECRYGAWTGGALKDLASEPLWRIVQDQPSAARFPDSEEFPGESIAEMQLRAVRAVRATDAAVARATAPTRSGSRSRTATSSSRSWPTPPALTSTSSSGSTSTRPRLRSCATPTGVRS